MCPCVCVMCCGCAALATRPSIVCALCTSYLGIYLLPGPQVLPPEITECLFWGMGSDGTVGANKEAVKIIANQPGMNAQAYFRWGLAQAAGGTCRAYPCEQHAESKARYR